MDKKALSSSALFYSKSWTVVLKDKANQLEVTNLETGNSSVAWLADGQLKMSGLTDRYMGYVTDDKELELHRHLASQYTNHLK